VKHKVKKLLDIFLMVEVTDVRQVVTYYHTTGMTRDDNDALTASCR